MVNCTACRSRVRPSRTCRKSMPGWAPVKNSGLRNCSPARRNCHPATTALNTHRDQLQFAINDQTTSLAERDFFYMRAGWNRDAVDLRYAQWLAPYRYAPTGGGAVLDFNRLFLHQPSVE